MALLIGIDTGGTYTDAVLFDEAAGIVATAKSLTTREDLAAGIGSAVDAVLAESGARPEEIALVSLSTTLATNALVEGHGGRVCLVLVGFDEGALGRGGLGAALGGDPVIFVAGGHDAHGRARAPMDVDALRRGVDALEGEVSAFAVASLFAVRNAEHEHAARELIRERSGRPVTCSHELSSRLDGPRRAMTCVLNARLVNLIAHLITAAAGLLDERGIGARLMVVRGDGALISADVAALRPIETILSGPAASLVGAAHLTGLGDALVSDIGGTTTDYAVLSGGRPELDPDGATVGGFRTMVEAVAMRTIGLGGDSEVALVPDGAGVRLTLGPRRVVPLALFARAHPRLVHDTLDRQLKADRHSETMGRFAVAVRRSGPALHALDPADRALFERLSEAPAALDAVLDSRARVASLARLLSRGLALVSSLTPTDAVHALDIVATWDGVAAGKGLALFARQKDGRGLVVGAGAGHVARWIVDTLQEKSALALLEAALGEDGRDRGHAARLAQDFLAAAARREAADLVGFEFGLTVPLVGLGASAVTYYPGVAARLGTESVVPEHAGVANAVGAVVGQVTVTANATITAPEPGVYRLFLGAEPEVYTDLDAALARARVVLAARVDERADAAGAGDVETVFAREDATATVEGREMLIELRLVATGTGRPRFAAGA